MLPLISVIGVVFLVVVLTIIAGMLGYFLRTHPGHPALESIQVMLKEEARQAQLLLVGRALQREGIVVPADPANVPASVPAVAPAAPPPLPVVASVPLK